MRPILWSLLAMVMAVTLQAADAPKPAPPKADAGNALEAARDFAAAGKYPEALERHIYFHEHVLESDPSAAGVRLTYALKDWVDLGEKYPKALDALKEIRDKKSDRLIGGEEDVSLFQDVAAINENLNEPKATIALFKELDGKQPALARKAFPLVDKSLMKAGEYPLVRRYLGDPKVHFDKDRSNYERGILMAEKSQNQPKTRAAVEKMFSDRVVMLVTVLDKTGDSALAHDIQAQALAVVNHPAIKNALP